MRGWPETEPRYDGTFRTCLLYLADVLIGSQDYFVESWRRDLDSLFESEGHHGSLKNGQGKREGKVNIYIR